MSRSKRTVYSHANTWNACLKVLEKMGFQLTVDAGAKLWIAENAEACLKANNPVELLGLAQLHASTAKTEVGERWWGTGDDVLRALVPISRGADSPLPSNRKPPRRTAASAARPSRSKRRSPI